MRCLGPAALWLALLSGLTGSLGSQVEQPYRLSVNLDLVVLNTSVRDHSGQFISDLRESDFKVYEDGVLQSIRLFRHEDIPITVGLVIDHSSSMRRKLPEVIAAARTFVRSSNQDDQVFIVNFNEHVTLGLSNEIGFSNHVEDLERAILHAPTVGMTALYDAVVEAQERLQAGTRDKKVLIVISDGIDNASKHSLNEVLKRVEESAALVYTIGVFDREDPDANAGVLKRIALATGGESFVSGEQQELVATCERIARDLRHQYTIGYVSTSSAKPGTYRSIRVAATTASGRKLNVRARTGYIAAEPVK